MSVVLLGLRKTHSPCTVFHAQSITLKFKYSRGDKFIESSRDDKYLWNQSMVLAAIFLRSQPGLVYGGIQILIPVALDFKFFCSL